jgi:hypothetical protein
LYSFPVLAERPNDLVAQFKVTVLILESGVIVATPVIFNPNAYKSEKSVTDEAIRKILEVPMQTGPAPKKQRTKKKKSKKPAAESKEDS